MRMTVHIESKQNGPVRLPEAYRHYLQAAVYGLLSEDLAAFLHGPGFLFEKRSFRLFTFSRLQSVSPPRREKDVLLFDSPLSFVLSSPVLDILEECAQGLLSGRLFRLGNNELLCSGVEVTAPVVAGTRVLLRTLSPITLYSTLRRGDGRPYTVYYEPQETAFSEQIASNLRKKQAALAGTAEKNCPGERDDAEVSQDPLLRFRPVGRVHRVTGFFSPGDTFPVKGWDGLFRLEGPQELLQLALDAGLGAKNSSGWGCVELVREAGDAEEATGAVSAVPCG